MIKRKFLLLISLVIIGGLSFIIYKRSCYDFTIVFTANVHAQIDQYLGYSRLSTVIKNIEKKDRRPLVFDAGNTFSGSTETHLTEGQYIVEILNAVGYSVLGLRQADFRFSRPVLKKIVSSLSFPVISTNILNENGEHEFLPSVIIPYRINLFKTINIGVISLITPDTKEKNNYSSVGGLVFSSSYELVQDEVNKLKEKADFIVLLSDLNTKYNNFSTELREADFYLKKVLSQVRGINAVIEIGAELSASHDTVIEGVPVFSGWNHLKYIGILNIKKSPFKKYNIRSNGIDYRDSKDNIEQDPKIVELIDKLNKEFRSKYYDVIGSSNVEIPLLHPAIRQEQTDLGRWLADVLMKGKDVDISVINAGTIRNGIKKGNITENDVFSVVPFKNKIVSIKISGDEFKDILEKSYSFYPNLFAGLLQVSSNVKFKLNFSSRSYNRISDIKISGKPLDKDKKYKILINSFLKDGGDGYNIFKDKKIIKEFGYMDEDLRNYIKNNSPISL